MVDPTRIHTTLDLKGRVLGLDFLMPNQMQVKYIQRTPTFVWPSLDARPFPLGGGSGVMRTLYLCSGECLAALTAVQSALFLEVRWTRI